MKLAGRQLSIMRLLWDQGEMSIAELQDALNSDSKLAYSTVATVVSRMEKKGLVAHRSVDRVYYYRAAVTEDSAGKTMVGEFVERIFGGSPSELVNHLLEGEQVDSSELRRIKNLVHEREAKLKKRGKS